MNRSDLESAIRLRPVPLEVPGSPLPLFLRPWTFEERSELLEWRRAGGDVAGLYARLVALSLCDSDGSRLYTTSDDDLKSVLRLDAQFVARVGDRAFELNGLGDGPKA